MKPIIICMGLPGTGKTTTAKLLEEKLEGYTCIHRPEVRAELGMEPYTDQKIPTYFEMLTEKVKQGEGIIIDRICSTHEIRKAYYYWAMELGLEVIAFNHVASEETAKKRIQSRVDPGNSTRPTNDPAKYDKYASCLEDPTNDVHKRSFYNLSLFVYDTERNDIDQLSLTEEALLTARQIAKVLGFL